MYTFNNRGTKRTPPYKGYDYHEKKDTEKGDRTYGEQENNQ